MTMTMSTPQKMISPEYLPEPGTVPKTIEHFESEIDLMSRSLVGSCASMGSLSSVFGGQEDLVVAEAARGELCFYSYAW